MHYECYGRDNIDEYFYQLLNLFYHVLYAILKTISPGPARWRKWLKVLALHALGSHMGAGSNPSSPASLPAPCLWPRKADRTAQSFGNLHPHGRPVRGSWLRIHIAPVVALNWEVNHRTRRASSLPLLSVYPPFQ